MKRFKLLLLPLLLCVSACSTNKVNASSLVQRYQNVEWYVLRENGTVVVNYYGSNGIKEWNIKENKITLFYQMQLDYEIKNYFYVYTSHYRLVVFQWEK